MVISSYLVRKKYAKTWLLHAKPAIAIYNKTQNRQIAGNYHISI